MTSPCRDCPHRHKDKNRHGCTVCLKRLRGAGGPGSRRQEMEVGETAAFSARLNQQINNFLEGR